MKSLYVGLMSGTSLDGVDGVLVDFEADGKIGLKVLAHAHEAFTPGEAAELLALNEPGDNELHRAALAANSLARRYASVVHSLLQSSNSVPASVQAIGAHGQTVRHRPGEFDGTGYTLQINSPALLAELTGIAVVADFRSRDVASGGQGAPLVSAFHRAVFGRDGMSIAVLNVGGISNLTVLRADQSTIGFDCGPGNALMDYWCQRHTGQPFDSAGQWAASGKVSAPLLTDFLSDPYFGLPPPKSTGRDWFHPAWLTKHLMRDHGGPLVSTADVQATLTELTASACASEVRGRGMGAKELLVCGGGSRNVELMRRLAANLPGVKVLPTDALGLPADQVEACAFAWLARAFERREAGNVSTVTGAAGSRILGALYPA